MTVAHLLPFLNPDEGEALEHFLERAATAHDWPEETRRDDLGLLRDLLALMANPAEERALAGHLLRALSFAAEPSMALRNMDRYIRNLGHERGVQELLKLRHNSEHLHFLSSLFSFSTYLSEIAIARPEFLDWIFKTSRMNHEKPLEKYRSQLAEWMAPIEGIDPRREALVVFKKRELLRIGIRDLMELGDTQSLCRELSNLAQAIIEVAYRDCLGEAIARHGRPHSDDIAGDVGFCVYAMGKFGAGELNFSSDVDLIFAYDEEGETEGVAEHATGRIIRRVSNHEFFGKVSRDLCQYLSNHCREGFLFRVDMRLRPEGKTGPLARSRPAYSAYLQGHAAIWEKIPYLKARFIAGDANVAKTLDAIFQQFVFSGNDVRTLFPEIARLKRRIDYERMNAESRELDIKRGRGGIREIEFIVAGLQLIHGEHLAHLRVRPTLEAAALLVRERLLDADDARVLTQAYHLFRRIEHTLQMMNESQTHEMPSAPRERHALALRCGFIKPDEFEKLLEELRSFVRSKFEQIFHVEGMAGKLTLVDYLFGEGEPTAEAMEALRTAGIGTREGFDSLRSLAVGTSEHAPSAKAQLQFQQLLPHMLQELPHIAQPEQAVRQFDLLLRAARGYTWVYDLCVSNPQILKMILRTLGFGSLLARQMISHPEWLDELLSNGGLYETRLPDMIEAFDLAFPKNTPDDAFRRLRQFKQLEGFLLSVQEVLAVTPSDHVAARMTSLADAVLRGACAIAQREALERVGEVALPGRWALIGLGGLGDQQVHYNGDLDIALVVEDDRLWHGEGLTRWADRMGQVLIARVAALTPEGQLWKMDARLRPEGKSGPLAATRERFVDYYRTEAGLWEWQVLTKARPVAGDLAFGNEVLAELHALFAERTPEADLGGAVAEMRGRIEASVTLPKTALFDMKRSAGGVIDVEFLVQYLQLRHRDEAATLFPLTTEQALEEFVRRGDVAEADGAFLLRHLKLLRAAQRAHRLLFETTHDYYPGDATRRDALRRGLADQVILNGLDPLDELPQHMARARALFRKYVG